MDKRTQKILTVTGCIWLTIGISCEKAELSNYIDTNDNSEKAHRHVIEYDSITTDDNPGFSFEVESDSLEEEIENIYFHSTPWEEEEITANL